MRRDLSRATFRLSAICVSGMSIFIVKSMHRLDLRICGAIWASSVAHQSSSSVIWMVLCIQSKKNIFFIKSTHCVNQSGVSFGYVLSSVTQSLGGVLIQHGELMQAFSTLASIHPCSWPAITFWGHEVARTCPAYSWLKALDSRQVCCRVYWTRAIASASLALRGSMGNHSFLGFLNFDIFLIYIKKIVMSSSNFTLIFIFRLLG